MHLVGPHILALQQLLGLGQCTIHIAFVDQFTRAARVAAYRIRGVLHMGHARPRLPMHHQFAHGLLGLLFTLGHDADKISLHHHRANAGNVCDAVGVNACQSAAYEVTMVCTRIRRSHHAPVQHAGHAHIVYINEIAKHFGSHVNTRRALSNRVVLLAGLEWGLVVQAQQHLLL